MIWIAIYVVAGVFMASRRPLVPSASTRKLRAILVLIRVVLWPVYAWIFVKGTIDGLRG